jgi:hypothetical protein
MPWSFASILNVADGRPSLYFCGIAATASTSVPGEFTLRSDDVEHEEHANSRTTDKTTKYLFLKVSVSILCILIHM